MSPEVEIAALKVQVMNLKEDITELRTEIGDLKGDVRELLDAMHNGKGMWALALVFGSGIGWLANTGLGMWKGHP